MGALRRRRALPRAPERAATRAATCRARVPPAYECLGVSVMDPRRCGTSATPRNRWTASRSAKPWPPLPRAVTSARQPHASRMHRPSWPSLLACHGLGHSSSPLCLTCIASNRAVAACLSKTAAGVLQRPPPPNSSSFANLHHPLASTPPLEPSEPSYAVRCPALARASPESELRRAVRCHPAAGARSGRLRSKRRLLPLQGGCARPPLPIPGEDRPATAAGEGTPPLGMTLHLLQFF